MNFTRRYLAFAGRLDQIESKKSDDADDSGGLTLCGISRVAWPNEPIWAMWDKYGMKVFEMQEFKDAVLNFYFVHFYQPLHCEELGPSLAWRLFDFGVNCGVTIPVEALQRILNAHNKQEKLWPDMPIDGKFGPRTLKAVNLMMSQGYTDENMAHLVAAVQYVRYLGIVERTPSQEKFINGWAKKRVLAED